MAKFIFCLHNIFTGISDKITSVVCVFFEVITKSKSLLECKSIIKYIDYTELLKTPKIK